MKVASLWRFLIIVIIIIIIIGGVIIIIIIGQIPEPICIACIAKRIEPLLGIAEIISGITALALINKIKNTKQFG
jgi:hypothetical protein